MVCGFLGAGANFAHCLSRATSEADGGLSAGGHCAAAAGARAAGAGPRAAGAGQCGKIEYMVSLIRVWVLTHMSPPDVETKVGAAACTHVPTTYVPSFRATSPQIQSAGLPWGAQAPCSSRLSLHFRRPADGAPSTFTYDAWAGRCRFGAIRRSFSCASNACAPCSALVEA